MRTYIVKRLIQIMPLLIGISALTFLLLQLAPGDFLNNMRENPAISQEVLEALELIEKCRMRYFQEIIIPVR